MFLSNSNANSNAGDPCDMAEDVRSICAGPQKTTDEARKKLAFHGFPAFLLCLSSGGAFFQLVLQSPAIGSTRCDAFGYVAAF